MYSMNIYQKEHKEHENSSPIKENENESWGLPARPCQKTCSCKVLYDINPNSLRRTLSCPPVSWSQVKYPETSEDIRKESDTHCRTEGNEVCESKTEKITSASENIFKTKGLFGEPVTFHMSMRGGCRVLLNRSKSVPCSPKSNLNNLRKCRDTSCHNKLPFNGDAEVIGNLRSSNSKLVTKHVTNGSSNRKLSSTKDAPQVIKEDSRLIKNKQSGDSDSLPKIYNVHIIDRRLGTLEIGLDHVSDNGAVIKENDNEMFENASSTDGKGIQVDEIVLQVQTENIGTNVIHVPPRNKYLEMSVPFNKSQAQNVKLLAQNRQNAMHKCITQTLGIIILVFLICWLPFCIAWPINTFCDCVNTRFYYFTYWAAYVNSTTESHFVFCNQQGL